MSTGPLYAITDFNGTLYTESPEEQALEPDEPQEYLIRFFLTRAECDRYLKGTRDAYQGLEFMMHTYQNLQEFWVAFGDARSIYNRTLSVEVRAALSDMENETWPSILEVVFSPSEPLH
jgi:hypothetical protein